MKQKEGSFFLCNAVCEEVSAGAKSPLLQHPHRAQAWDTNPKELKVQKRRVTIA